MNYSLNYRSSRSEVWRFYWAAWGARLWRLHLLVAALLAFVLPDMLGVPPAIRSYVLYFFGALPAVTLFFALWPQVMFKSKERTLLVGPDGWSTKIGNRSGSRRWAEIASVQEARGFVVITSTTGNALIIPAYAFTDDALKSQFVKDSQAWHRAHAVYHFVQGGRLRRRLTPALAFKRGKDAIFNSYNISPICWRRLGPDFHAVFEQALRSCFSGYGECFGQDRHAQSVQGSRSSVWHYQSCGRPSTSKLCRCSACISVQAHVLH